jgi:hypothetical protein
MNKIFTGAHAGEIILGILLIFYLLLGYSTPEPIAELVNSLPGKIIMLFIIVGLFLYSHPVLATLALFVCFDLMRRTKHYSYNNTNFDVFNLNSNKEKASFKPIPEYPIQVQKNNSGDFTEYNQFPYTLEQEVVKKMVPLKTSSNELSKPSYKPTLEHLYDASPVNNTN